MFLVFAGDHYYPKGGWDDLQGVHSTLAEAEGSVEVEPSNRKQWKINQSFYNWYQIVDARTLKLVKEDG